MEIDELKKNWQLFGLKLNNIEKINKRLILESLSKKPKRKLNWLQGRIIYAIIVTPLVFIIAIPKFFKIENMDWQMLVGVILSISVLCFLMCFYLKGYLTLTGINVNKDSIVESVRKVCRYKSLINTRQKYLWISYPVLLAGIVLIERKTLNFDITGLLYIIVILGFLYVTGYEKFKYEQKEIKNLEKDLIELEEYL